MARSPHSVHYGLNARSTEKLTRLELLVRLLAFLALGVVGGSFCAIFLFAYLMLPVFAASRLAAGRDPDAYLHEDGPRVLAGLRWLAAVSAWAGLTAARLPLRSPDETVTLAVETSGHPTASSAIGRVLAGLPSALALALLGWVGVLIWLWAALSVLASERVPRRAFDFLVGLQRWSLRLLVYQASLVDEYPPFSFADDADAARPGSMQESADPTG